MLTIVIVNYETVDLTVRCARSVQDAPPGETHETIVVDNGSSPATVDALRALDGVRLVETGVNGGFAAAVNRCMREADPASDVVVVLNSDTEVQAGALDALAAAARRDRVGLAAPLLLERDGRLQRSAHRRFPSLWTTWLELCLPLALLQMRLERVVRPVSLLSSDEHESGVRPLHVMGAVMAFRREAWDAVGSFDTRFFMYLEETDWQQRLHAAGWAVELVSAARVCHLHRGGEAGVFAPPPRYLDSARTYFGAQGHRDATVRAVLACGLLMTWVTLLLLRPFARWLGPRREPVVASLAPARRALVHVVLGRVVPRPDGAQASAPA